MRLVIQATLEIAGVRRGEPGKTPSADTAAPGPLGQVKREFWAPAPNRLWGLDFTYAYGAIWRGFADVAFVIDAFARRIGRGRRTRSPTRRPSADR